MRVISQSKIQSQHKKGLMNFKLNKGDCLEFLLQLSQEIDVSDMRYQMAIKPPFHQAIYANIQKQSNGIFVQVPAFLLYGNWRKADYEIVMSFGYYERTILQGQILIK